MTGLTITASQTVGVFVSNTAQNPITVEPGVQISYSSGYYGFGIASTYPVPWSVTNFGTIIGNVPGSGFSDGLLFDNSSPVIDNAGGFISGALNGIYTNEGAAITNSGSIAGNNDGIETRGPTTINNTGSIGGGLGGIYTFGVTSITNDGRISGVTAAGAVLVDGGSVTNQSQGTFIGGYDGILGLGSATTVANSGSLIGSTYAGIILKSGGTVTNQAGALVEGYRFGARIAGQADVDNSGTIMSQMTSAAAGVLMDDGGYVINRGNGLIASQFVGVDIATDTTAAAGTVVNQGSIYGAAIGVQVNSAPATLTNAGRITAAPTGTSIGVLLDQGGSVSNTGAISGNQFGIDVNNAAGTVVNQGSIGSAYFQYGAGVALTDGGTVTNAAGAEISSTWKGVQIGSPLAQAPGGTVVNQGVILANDVLGDGAALWLHGPGVVYNAPGALISGGAFGVVAYYGNTTLVNKGSVFATQYAFDAVNPGNANRVVVYPSASFTGIVNANDTIGAATYSVLELASAASTGTLVGLGTQFLNFGEVVIDSGARWSVDGTVVAGETVVLAGNGDALTLTSPSTFDGTLSGFTSGDTVTLAGISNVVGLSLSADNILSVLRSDAPAVTIQLSGSLAVSYAASGGSTELTVPCFTAGTLIRTPGGDVPVETIEPGMAVINASGEVRPVIWVGRRHVDCTRHKHPRKVWPIQIDAHAFGPGLPARDLRVSPDHAIYVDEVLIPARRLVNGTTIRQVRVDWVAYFHVELPNHDIILAEGLGTESYLDTGDRSNFSNVSPVRLFPDFSTPSENLAAIWETKGYAPLVVHGPMLEAVRAKLMTRVAQARHPRLAEWS
ncbi:MAG TPA: Hint domain-containing protein [Rhodopila sp.]|nr:Hint domain-containing protein [Rhodopila sp.]